MEASEAMQVLERAGRADEAQEVVDQAITRAQKAYEAIEADETRTPEWKREQIDGAYADARESLTKALAAKAETALSSERRDYQSVLGVLGVPGDSASLAISRRDAADRVAAVEGSQELRDLLDSANRMGDELLARAVAERALTTRNVDVLNAFLADRPRLQDSAQRLWDAALAGDTAESRFAHTLKLAGLFPPQLVG